MKLLKNVQVIHRKASNVEEQETEGTNRKQIIKCQTHQIKKRMAEQI